MPLSFRDSVKTSIKAAVYMTNGVTQYIICYCLPGQAICDEVFPTIFQQYRILIIQCKHLLKTAIFHLSIYLILYPEIKKYIFQKLRNIL